MAARQPLVVRKRFQRQAARQRIARGTRRSPTAAQLSFDPLARPGHRPARRTLGFWLAVLGSVTIHAAAVAVGFSMRTSRQDTPPRQEVKIVVREKPPEPPPVVAVPEVVPEVETPVPPPPRPKLAKIPPPSAPPPEPTKTPPVRVVGLSLESTTEGGDGPSFAVGNTRFGETATRAVDPNAVTAHPGLDPDATAARGVGLNRAATRIPVEGIKIELPRRRVERKPDYPPLLKTQGIEDDVMVMVSLDATGKVASVKLVKPSQHPEMNASALLAAKSEDFEPATRDGVPIPYSFTYKIRFRLEEE